MEDLQRSRMLTVGVAGGAAALEDAVVIILREGAPLPQPVLRASVAALNTYRFMWKFYCRMNSRDYLRNPP